ncbi:MAG: pilus assembly protein PilC [Gammaproteobacteria bacterium]|nr:pilus assembly protein PilC [Gammaproteobacteria bacterium]
MKSNPILLAVLAMPSLGFPLQAAGAPANNPLFLTSGVTPNIFFQVDDSGSMDWTILTKKHWEGRAYDPDFGGDNNATSDTNSAFREDGLFFSNDAPRSATSGGTFREFAYVYKSSDDKYSNGCSSGGYQNSIDQCGGTAPNFDPVDNDWRIRAAALNVLYYDPTATYKPWAGLSDATFTAVRDNPQPDEAGYDDTRSLVGYVYEVAIDDKGYTGCSTTTSCDTTTSRPKRGSDFNVTTGANGLVDLWDSHTTVKFTSSGAEVTTTTYTPTSTSIGAAVSSVTTLSGSSTHAALGGLTVDETKQNFANWYEYHRRRSYVAKAAIGEVVTDSPDYRYGLGLINDTLFVPMPAATVTDYTTHNTSLLNSFYSYNWQAKGTPLSSGLQRAGKYYQNTLTGKPTPITHSCQQNFTVLITDGYSYNENLTVNDSDGDGYSDSLADVAHYYYQTDLSGLTNDVPTSTFDTATHQHMVTFGVAFGVQGNLVDTDGDGWPDPVKTEASNWGDPSLLDSPEKIDDLWHAAYNSRGTFIAAQTPEEVASALSDAIKAIESLTGSASSAATNSTTLDTGSRVFQARFNSDDWSGQLRSLTISTSAVIASTEEWDAGVEINSQVASTSDTRVIITKGSSDGVAFAYANLTGPTGTAGTQQNLLDKDGAGTTDGRGPDRVGYLRGHSQHEGDTAGTFRQRSISVLGDIVNSNPWYVGAPSAGHSDVDHPGYSTFREDYKDRKPVAYVGANDGMLHGFDASIDADDVSMPGANAGKEVLGYVPTPVYANLSRLTDQDYNANHRYFVDGSPMVADACVANCGSSSATWKSVLVGSLNAGGKGYFALNVTNPAGTSSAAAPTFSETNAGDILLWEFTDSDDADLGLTYNYPASHPTTQQAKQIVKMENGKWAVVLGNGYYSTDGKAVLYVLFLADGEDGVWSSGDFVKIVADSGTGNGLSTPTPFDSDGNGLADTIYAGDLKGNMWKFNVSSAASTSWGVAFSGAPLYVAQDAAATPNRQPIIAPPEVTLHPNGGRMVLFGTGKYIETTDPMSTGTQSFYGVWDDGTWDGTAWTDGSAVAGRSSLDQKLVGSITLSGKSYPVITSGTTVSSPKGWYADFSGGERVTGIPKLRNGLIIYDTFSPPATPCAPDDAGKSMVHNYLTGDMPAYPVFDTDGDGDVDDSDTAVAGLYKGASVGGTTLISGAAGSTTGAAISSLNDGSLVSNQFNFGAGSRGRITWREIVQ